MVVNAHGKYFCDAADSATYGGTRYCSTAGTLPGGDVRPESLFSGAKTTPNDTDALTYTPVQVDAARAYINNATALLNARGLAKQDVETRAGMEYLAMALGANARINLANKSMFDALARRVPMPQTSQTTALINQIIAANPNRSPAAQAYYNRLLTTGISFLDLMDAEVDRRYRNPTWYANMAGASPEAVGRERAFMQAWQMELGMKQFLLMERIDVELGQLLAQQVRQDSEPKLIAKLQEIHPGLR
jgi:hypothetical protein